MELFGFSLFCNVIILTQIMPSFTDGMQIQVKYGSKEFSVQLNKKDTVATLKAKIEKIKEFGNIPIQKQRLTKKSGRVKRVLADEKTIEKYRIDEGDNIYVEVVIKDESSTSSSSAVAAGMPSSTGGFRIYVSLPVEVEDTDTVATLKQKIEEMTKIPPKQQTIRSQDIPNGHMLVDEKKLKDYKISIKSNVYLWTEFEISVWHNGNNYKVITNGTDTVQSLKKKIKPKIERDLNRIIKPIKLSRHTTAGTVEFRDNDTLDECGINGVHDIYVTFDQNQYFAAGKLTMLITITDGMQIDVKYGGQDYPVEVNKTDTVATLKQKIGKIKELGPIPAEKQILRWNSGGPVLNESNKKLEEYGIKKIDDIIVSWDEFQIFVQYERTKYPFVVKPEDTVQILKEKLKQIIDILPEKQVLSRDKDGCYFGNEQTIEYCEIVKDDTIFLSLDFKISVYKGYRTFGEDVRPSKYFKVTGTDTVQSLKDRIRKEKGAEWNCAKGEIKLRKDDRERTELVNNEATLEQYGIRPGEDLLFSIKLW